MTTYVALLRGINLGPKRKVPMAALRETLEDAGYGDVRTYIQSGNVVLTSRKAAKTVGPHIEKLIEESTGLVVPVVLRTAAEMARTFESNPFAGRTDDHTKLHVVFSAEPLPTKHLNQIDRSLYVPEEFAVSGRDIYLYMPNGLGRSKLGQANFDKVFGFQGTTRNWRTVTTLVEMANS